MRSKVCFGFLIIFALAACGSEEEAATEPVDSTTSTTNVAAELDEVEEEIDSPDDSLAFIEEPTGRPVSTVGASTGSTDLYVGILGRLGLNEDFTEAVTDQPETLPGRHPLTGLPGTVKDRPAAVVKIDNGLSASPQAGLEVADIVYEEPVEGGLTRLAAVFQSQGSTVGPVRSGRTTDIAVISSFGQPLYLYSGANTQTDS